MEHDQRYGETAPFLPHHGHWPEAPGYHPHHHAPPHDYNGTVYGYSESSYGGPHAHSVPRSSHQQLQPLVVPPQWPSMLPGQSSYTPYSQNSAPPLHHPPSAPPISHPQSAPPQMTVANSKHHVPNQRKTLSEADRRKMCLYAEDNPTKKQTEIGLMFGVERSTVSKVLRQKERYLGTNDGSRSPMKKPRSKFPDIERALTNWVKNQENRGRKLTDDMIREQAKVFSTATHGGADAQANINSSKWLNDFKRRTISGGKRSRKNSFRSHKSHGTLSRSSHEALSSASGLSPNSTNRLATPSTADMFSHSESPGNVQHHLGNGHALYHSQSNASLASSFATEGTPPTAFSAEHTPADSPFFPMAILNTDSQHDGTTLPATRQAGTALQRSRSQTFPVVPTGSAGYMSPPASSQTGTPKFVSSNLATGSSPSGDMPPPSSKPSRSEQSHQQSVHPYQQASYRHEQDQNTKSQSIITNNGNSPSHDHSKAESQQQHVQSNGYSFQQTTKTPPSKTQAAQINSPSPSAKSSVSQSNQPSVRYDLSQATLQPSQDEARAALEVVMQYFQNQKPGTANAGGVAVEPQEFVMIGKLVERLKMQHTPAPVPAQLYRSETAGYAFFQNG